jgi:hypothetical protein
MGTGKISALSLALRDELARRLSDGQTGLEALAWLNAQPEVIARMKERFDGAPVTSQNLNNWIETGYADWRRRQERAWRNRQLAEYARKIGGDTADVLSGGAAIAGGVLMEILDELDAERQKDLLKECPENLPAFINALARLQGEQTKHRAVKLKAEKQSLDERRLQLEREKWELGAVEKLMKKATSKEVQDIMGSSKPRAIKADLLRAALFGTPSSSPAAA